MARNGDPVSCGATLVADGGSMQGNFILDFLDWLFEEDYYPGRGLPEEEVCVAAQAMLESEEVRAGLAEMLKLTNASNWEYSAYIIEVGAGEYSLSPLKTNKEILSVAPGPAPDNAVGQIHTHPNSLFGDPSEQDSRYIRAQEEKMLAYFVIGSSGDIGVSNDEGERIWCD